MKREIIVTVRIPALGDVGQESIEKGWNDILPGFDGVPAVWQEKNEWVLRADFETPKEAARFTAVFQKLTGCPVTLGPHEEQN